MRLAGLGHDQHGGQQGAVESRRRGILAQAAHRPLQLAEAERDVGVGAVVGAPQVAQAPRRGLQQGLIELALQAVRDPGNLGTVLRTADAAGCGGVILVGETCDPFSVEAVRATMGSMFAVPLHRASVEAFLAWRRGWPGVVVGTLLTATHDHRTAPYRDPTLILMGNEQQGLPPELAAACDLTVKIPMRGRADSLNLAVATGIMIYAAGG